jgi:beta-1,4-N-acetylglucosaminyltransferase
LKGFDREICGLNSHMMKKIGIITSSGGHLTQALSAIEAFQGYEVFLVVHNFPTLKGMQLAEVAKIYRLRLILGYTSTLGVLLTTFVNVFQFIKIFWVERPAVLFSTGAEIALPAFYIGKALFRTRLIFLETLTRVKDLSLTGKLIYPIADLFLVQWPELVSKKRPKAAYQGRLI